MVKKYLVVGNYGNHNIGDETILKGLIKELSKNGKNNVQVYIPTRNLGFEKKYHNELEGIIVSFYVYNFRYFLKYFKKTEEVIIGGGGIWSGYTGPLAKIIPFFTFLSKLWDKRVSYRGIGIYKTASFIERGLINFAILISDESSIRDKESYNSLWSICRKKTKIQHDFAFKYLNWLNNNRDKFNELLENSSIYKKLCKVNKNRCVIGLSLKPTKNLYVNRKIIREIVKVMNMLYTLHKNIIWVFFPFSTTNSIIENDLQMAIYIIRMFKNKKDLIIVPHTNPIIWYFIIKDAIDIFIGMRYHSLIFTWIANRPFYGISYENKNTDFLLSIKHPYWSSANNVSANKLFEFIKLHLG